jgi:hypothetical protein
MASLTRSGVMPSAVAVIAGDSARNTIGFFVCLAMCHKHNLEDVRQQPAFNPRDVALAYVGPYADSDLKFRIRFNVMHKTKRPAETPSAMIFHHGMTF